MTGVPVGVDGEASSAAGTHPPSPTRGTPATAWPQAVSTSARSAATAAVRHIRIDSMTTGRAAGEVRLHDPGSHRRRVGAHGKQLGSLGHGKANSGGPAVPTR